MTKMVSSISPANNKCRPKRPIYKITDNANLNQKNKFTRHNSLSLPSAHINPCLYLALNMCSSDVYNVINLHAHLYISFLQRQTSAGPIPVWVSLNYSEDPGICFPFFFSHFKTLEMENVHRKLIFI